MIYRNQIKSWFHFWQQVSLSRIFSCIYQIILRYHRSPLYLAPFPSLLTNTRSYIDCQKPSISLHFLVSVLDLNGVGIPYNTLQHIQSYLANTWWFKKTRSRASSLFLVGGRGRGDECLYFPFRCDVFIVLLFLIGQGSKSQHLGYKFAPSSHLTTTWRVEYFRHRSFKMSSLYRRWRG